MCVLMQSLQPAALSEALHTAAPSQDQEPAPEEQQRFGGLQKKKNVMLIHFTNDN